MYSKMHKYSFFFLSSVLSAVLLSCSPSPQTIYDVQAGTENISRLISRQGELSDTETAEYLRYLEHRLERGIQPHSSARLQIVLLNSPKREAYSADGGYIAISRGLVLSLGSEAELAFIVAHEIAHQLLGHSVLARQDSSQLKEYELAADRYATGIIAVAGYDPRVARYALQHAYGGNFGSGTDTHPALQKRVDTVESLLANSHWHGPGTVNRRGFKVLQHRLAGL